MHKGGQGKVGMLQKGIIEALEKGEDTAPLLRKLADLRAKIEQEEMFFTKKK